MRRIYRAASIIDAHLVKGRLEEAGIAAYVAGEYLTGAMGELPVTDLVSVMVADADVETAEAIARSVDAFLQAPSELAGDEDAELVSVPM